MFKLSAALVWLQLVHAQTTQHATAAVGATATALGVAHLVRHAQELNQVGVGSRGGVSIISAQLRTARGDATDDLAIGRHDAAAFSRDGVPGGSATAGSAAARTTAAAHSSE